MLFLTNQLSDNKYTNQSTSHIIPQLMSSSETSTFFFPFDTEFKRTKQPHENKKKKKKSLSHL